MATLYKRGQTFWIKWYKDGKAHYESLKTREKSKAKLLLNAKEIELRTGNNPIPKDDMSFEDFAATYLHWHADEHPAHNERVHQIVHSYLIPEFGQFKMHQLEPVVVEHYKQKRRRTKNHKGTVPAAATINKELKTLRAVVNKAVEWNVLAKNHLATVKDIKAVASKPINYYTVEQLNEIYETDPDHADVWRLLANTGMRRAEAYNLTWDYVLEQHIRVVSTEDARTKDAEWRDIPISPGCCDALNALAKNYTASTYVLPRVHKDSISRAFKKVVGRVGGIGSLHDLRHTFISHLVMQGVPLRTVQVLAGHSTIRVTEQYSHLSPNYMVDAVANLKL